MSKLQILVTGINGFVGRALSAEAISRGLKVQGATRAHCDAPKGVTHTVVGNIDGNTDWCDALTGCDGVVHLAARVHVMSETSANPLMEFRRVNVEGTLNLGRQAAANGVRRFVFVSSIKVNGETTLRGLPFQADDAPAPLDAYGVSKMEAEQGLREIASQTGMEVVIIRPPLIYGPGVKANFAVMMRWLERDLALPLGAIHNQRSLVALDNLVDLILLCLNHPAAANQTFFVSDGEDVSTSELLRQMGQALGHPARLLSVPESWLKLAMIVVGKAHISQRLCGSLQLDIEKTRSLLGWTPPLTLSEGLKKAADHISR